MTSVCGGGTFDPDALRAKYAEERRRRLRSDGISQYVEIAGAFRKFGDDPWADPDFRRDPIKDSVDVAVVGAGFGGLLIGARCKQLGVDNVRLIDKAADVGGTWYWNRYPGIACDVESTSTCRFSRSSVTSRPKSTPRAPKSGRTAAASLNTTTSTATHACRPRFTKSVGNQPVRGG